MPARRFVLPVSVVLVVLWSGTAFAAEGGSFASALEKGWGWAYLAAFGWGFLTSLTPCVYPMIPITVAVFGARESHVTRRKAFLLASCYVLGIAVLYSVLGTAFAAAGKTSGAGELLGNPWVVVPIAASFLALAASMFGAFDLNLPMSVQNRLSAIGGSGYGGAFAMGLVGGILAAPCTGPPLLSILLWVSTTENVVAGSTVLFVYALGMGILFWVLAVFASALPKSGAWMDSIKSFFGIVMVVAAIYFLGNIPALKALHHGRPDLVFLVASLVLFAIGVAAGAIHLTFHGSWGTRLRKGGAVALAVIGASGAVNWFTTADRELAWHSDESAAFAEARASGKHVLIDFGAEWCTPCKDIEKLIASDALYADIADQFVPFRVDLTDISDAEEAMQDRYEAHTLPAVLLVSADGKVLARYTEKSPTLESFRSTLAQAAAAAP